MSRTASELWLWVEARQATVRCVDFRQWVVELPAVTAAGERVRFEGTTPVDAVDKALRADMRAVLATANAKESEGNPKKSLDSRQV